MEFGTPALVQHRDRGLARLNDLTVAIAIGAAGLLGTFAILAAATIPGKSDSTALAATGTDGTGANSGSTSSTNGSTTGQAPLQRPDDNTFTQGGSTTPIVVSGGSR
jgi:cytoskeletal protein RodZ